ncbi:MAG TPA: nuclear transport factor 2 family protein [Acidimicrobiales bacterium]|nr:nuclear transport factor 2 family protein [Acidimicrobiales bacterium]
MATELTYADVVAGVGAAVADYTHALDDGRTDDLVATFCPDGSCDMPGLGRHQGHQALRQAYGRFTPAVPQRHLVLNTHVTDWDGDVARATSDVVLLIKGDAGWVVQVVGRYHDVLHRDGDVWRFHSRLAEFVS